MGIGLGSLLPIYLLINTFHRTNRKRAYLFYEDDVEQRMKRGVEVDIGNDGSALSIAI